MKLSALFFPQDWKVFTKAWPGGSQASRGLRGITCLVQIELQRDHDLLLTGFAKVVEAR